MPENSGASGDAFVQENAPVVPSIDASRPSGPFEKWMMSEIAGIPIALMVCAAAAVVLGGALAMSSNGNW